MMGHVEVVMWGVEYVDCWGEEPLRLPADTALEAYAAKSEQDEAKDVLDDAFHPP